MVKHIVLFKLKDSLSQAEKEVVIQSFKEAIEALPKVIPFIIDIHVGGNCNPDEQWDICLNSTFHSLDDIKTYAAHPAHVAAASLLKDAKTDRACVDFEC